MQAKIKQIVCALLMKTNLLPNFKLSKIPALDGTRSCFK